MLAGLLFANHDAEDRPDRLAATLPFGGVTLVEYQARLLIAAGASQIVVVVARLTPELLGAVARIGRRGVTVDAVRSAGEIVEKLHPLAHVLMLGDGLVTTEPVVRMLAGEGGDLLLVVPEADAAPGFERIGGHMAWAGIARLDPRRIAEVAALPNDYDLQSTLLRIAAQARATHMMLPAEAIRQGHGIERQARTLEERGRAVMAGIVTGRRGWFDRFVLAPVAWMALPLLVERSVSATTVGGVSAGVSIAGIAAIGFGYPAIGLILALVACLGFGIGTTLAGMRDETALARGQAAATGITSALAVLTLAFVARAGSADDANVAVAVALVVLAALGERAIVERRRVRWWSSPPACLLVAAPFVFAGMPLLGLSAAAIYAAATLAAAIERLRQP